MLSTLRVISTCGVRSALQVTVKPPALRSYSVRDYATRVRSIRSRLAEEVKVKTPSSTGAGAETAIGIGKGVVAGGAAVGLGTLCYYAAFSKEASTFDRAALWPDYVQARIRDTYMYLAGSLGVTGLSAYGVYTRAPRLLEFVSRGGILPMIASLAAVIGTSMLCQSIEYKPGVGMKQAAWLLHTATMGAFLAPMCLLGGPLLIRAAWMTAGMVGGLSALAMCAPSERFLNMGGPLAIGLGVVFCSSIGSAFLPPTGALGASLYSIAVYGGLVLFGAFLLYDTQRVIRRAEHTDAYQPIVSYGMNDTARRRYAFDPINAQIGLYADVLNIFIRIAMILSGGGSGRRR